MAAFISLDCVLECSVLCAGAMVSLHDIGYATESSCRRHDHVSDVISAIFYQTQQQQDIDTTYVLLFEIITDEVIITIVLKILIIFLCVCRVNR